MEKFSFLSALTGSLITACFSYSAWIVQKYVMARSDRKRLAFFYLTKVCEILALKRAIEAGYKAEIDEFKNKIGDNKYALHMICIGLSEVLKGNITLPGNNEQFPIETVITLIRQLDRNKEEYFGYKIDNEIVSKFPNKAVLNYHFFLNYLKQLQSSLSNWVISIEQSDFKIYTPEYLYSQIMGVRRLLESAESLAGSLTKECGIKKKEVDEVVTRQVQELSANIGEYKYNKQVTDIITKVLDRAKLDAQQNDEIGVESYRNDYSI